MNDKELSKATIEELDLLAIPAEYTGRFVEMDPATDDLVIGYDLKEGMIVILESSHGRTDPGKTEKTSYDEEMLRVQNRWCRVDHLRTDYQNDAIHQFVGVYGDGTKHSRTYNKQWYWIVKKSSL